MARPYQISEIQCQAIDCLKGYFSTPEMAEILDTTEETIRYHRDGDCSHVASNSEVADGP